MQMHDVRRNRVHHFHEKLLNLLLAQSSCAICVSPPIRVRERPHADSVDLFVPRHSRVVGSDNRHLVAAALLQLGKLHEKYFSTTTCPGRVPWEEMQDSHSIHVRMATSPQKTEKWRESVFESSRMFQNE